MRGGPARDRHTTKTTPEPQARAAQLNTYDEDTETSFVSSYGASREQCLGDASAATQNRDASESEAGRHHVTSQFESRQRHLLGGWTRATVQGGISCSELAWRWHPGGALGRRGDSSEVEHVCATQAVDVRRRSGWLVGSAALSQSKSEILTIFLSCSFEVCWLQFVRRVETRHRADVSCTSTRPSC